MKRIISIVVIMMICISSFSQDIQTKLLGFNLGQSYTPSSIKSSLDKKYDTSSLIEKDASCTTINAQKIPFGGYNWEIATLYLSTDNKLFQVEFQKHFNNKEDAIKLKDSFHESLTSKYGEESSDSDSESSIWHGDNGIVISLEYLYAESRLGIHYHYVVLSYIHLDLYDKVYQSAIDEL